MALSPEQRQQLLSRADGLRTEVSALEAERDAAVTDKSQDVQDAKLLAEVINLENRRDVAEKQRDAVTVGTDQAMEIMEAAIAAQASASREAESTPTVSADIPADLPTEAPVELDVVNQESASSQMSGPANKGKGGNR